MLGAQPFILLSRQCVVKSVMRKEGGLGDVERGIIKGMKGNLPNCMGCFKGVVFLGYAGDLRVFPVACPAAVGGREGRGSFSQRSGSQGRWELLSSRALFLCLASEQDLLTMVVVEKERIVLPPWSSIEVS